MLCVKILISGERISKTAADNADNPYLRKRIESRNCKGYAFNNKINIENLFIVAIKLKLILAFFWMIQGLL